MKNFNIAIIGAGCTGTMIAAQQMLKIIEQKAFSSWANTPDFRVNFKLYDKDGAIGRGEPYAEDKDSVFLLNQPAYAMSPFSKHPDHFVKWLKNNNLPYDQDRFVPRDTYGRYLQEVFKSACELYSEMKQGHVDVSISNVMNIIPSAQSTFTVISDDYEAQEADIVILAPGHSRSPLLSEHSSNPRYFAAPYDVERAQNILDNSSDPAVIVGTSQSMLDCLAMLDHIGFSNTIYAVSRRMVKPWLFDAKAHRLNARGYDYQYLTPEAVSGETELSFDDLRTLFERDIEEGYAQGFPFGHMVSRLNPALLAENITNRFTHDNFEKFVAHVAALYGNPTSPERYKLMTEYEKRGQLKFVQADILEANIETTEDGFYVELNNNGPIKVSSIFNSSSYSMKAIQDNTCVASPLLRRLDQKKALKRHERDQNAFAFGEQNWNNLYLAGPICNSQRWGVETFRESISHVAESSVQKIAQGLIAAPA